MLKHYEEWDVYHLFQLVKNGFRNGPSPFSCHFKLPARGYPFLPARGCAFQKTSYDATPRANIKTTRSVDFFGETKLKSKGVSTSGQEPFLGVNKNLWLKVKLPLFPLKVLHWISLYRKSGHLGFLPWF